MLGHFSTLNQRRATSEIICRLIALNFRRTMAHKLWIYMRTKKRTLWLIQVLGEDLCLWRKIDGIIIIIGRAMKSWNRQLYHSYSFTLPMRSKHARAGGEFQEKYCNWIRFLFLKLFEFFFRGLVLLHVIDCWMACKAQDYFLSNSIIILIIFRKYVFLLTSLNLYLK